MDTGSDAGKPRMLCRLLDIPEGEAIAVEPPDDAGDCLIVWRQGDAVRAWVNVCPHAGRRLDWAPGRFLISGGTLICAVHGASFRTQDGLCVGGPCRGEHLRAVPVVVSAGTVYAA